MRSRERPQVDEEGRRICGVCFVRIEHTHPAACYCSNRCRNIAGAEIRGKRRV